MCMYCTFWFKVKQMIKVRKANNRGLSNFFLLESKIPTVSLHLLHNLASGNPFTTLLFSVQLFRGVIQQLEPFISNVKNHTNQ